MKDVVAHTNLDPAYPGYINVTPIEGGMVRVTVRGDPARREGIFVCGYSRDRGQPGRCTPGDANCNNYCNSAPEKGPMQNKPKPASHVDPGATATLTLSAEVWADLLRRSVGE
jgi:hypothetical protein